MYQIIVYMVVLLYQVYGTSLVYDTIRDLRDGLGDSQLVRTYWQTSEKHVRVEYVVVCDRWTARGTNYVEYCRA